MNEKSKVTAKVKVEIHGQTLKLTKSEARKLQAALNDELGALQAYPSLPPVSVPTVWQFGGQSPPCGELTTSSAKIDFESVILS